MSCIGTKNIAFLQNCVSLEQLSLSSLRKGMYVTGDVTSVVSTPDTELATGRWYSVAIIDAVTKTTWYTITLIVPRAYLGYFEVSTRTPKANASLSLQGKIVDEIKYGLNYDGLKVALGVDSDEAVHRFVSPKYAIRIPDFSSKTRTLWAGVCLLLSGTLVFWSYRNGFFTKTLQVDI